MGIYIVTLCLIPCLSIIINKLSFVGESKTKLLNKNKTYFICISLWLFLVEALRNYTVGRDTITYLIRYKMLANAKWENIFALADRLMFEHGFVVFNKLLSCINSNPRFFIVSSAFIIIFSYSWCIYKNSTIPWLSYFMFITLGMFNESINTTRQYIAVAICLLSYNYIRKNNIFKFIILILLAYTIHKSALIVLPMFWIAKIRFNKNNIYTIMSLTLIVMYLIFANFTRIFNFISQYIGTYGRYYASISTKIGNGSVGLVLIYIPFLFLVIIELYNRVDESRNMYIAFAMASVILVLLTFKTGIIERIIPYFSVMFLFSIPKSITSIKSRIIREQYLTIICIVLLLYYYFIICRANITGFLPYKLWDNSMII